MSIELSALRAIANANISVPYSKWSDICGNRNMTEIKEIKKY